MGNENELKKIEKLEEKRKTAKLLKYLKDGDPEIVAAAMGALAKIGDEDGVNSVVKLIDSADLEIRKGAIKASGVIGTQYAKTLLQQRLAKETDADVKQLLLDTLHTFAVK